MIRLVILLILGSYASQGVSTSLGQRRQALLRSAAELVEESEVSYAYGGHRLGKQSECKECNLCLEAAQSQPRRQLSACPECRKCSIDCSHFTQLALARAGLRHSYLTTETMLATPDQLLKKKFNFISLGRQVEKALPGDLLVYKGHVVMLEKLGAPGVGVIVHATGGKELKGSGMGIQRQRQVNLANFRGPLLRILRHVGLVDPHF